MKKFLFLSINFFAIIFTHAQTTPPPGINFNDSTWSKRIVPSQQFSSKDSMKNELRKNLFQDANPPAGSMRKGFKYLGKNQNGFDVYQTMHDNMYILKPDSSFVSNMPVLKMSIEERPSFDEKKN
jgi:hypothetical protein